MDITVILKISTGNEAIAALELRRRGFLVVGNIRIVESHTTCFACFALCLSKKLVIKLALQEGILVKPLKKYTLQEVLLIGNASLSVVRRCQHININEVWLAQSNRCIGNINGDKSQTNEKILTIAEVNKVCDYFGPQIALELEFLSYYAYHLVVPSAVGVVLLFQQVYTGEHFQSRWIPFYCLFLGVWSSGLMLTWKQRIHCLSMIWGTLGAEEQLAHKELLSKVVTLHIASCSSYVFQLCSINALIV
jgi:hypothetical protein